MKCDPGGGAVISSTCFLDSLKNWSPRLHFSIQFYSVHCAGFMHDYKWKLPIRIPITDFILQSNCSPLNNNCRLLSSQIQNLCLSLYIAHQNCWSESESVEYRIVLYCQIKKDEMLGCCTNWVSNDPDYIATLSLRRWKTITIRRVWTVFIALPPKVFS